MWIKEDSDKHGKERDTETEREREREERMETEPRERERERERVKGGCESAAGFPGFVVMTTKPPLPDQTEIRAITDGNAYTNAHVGRVRKGKRAERCRRKEKAGSTDAQTERETARRGSETEFRLHPKITPAHAVPPIMPYPPIVLQPPPSGRPSFVASRTPGQRLSTWPENEPTYRVLRPPIDRVCCTPDSDSLSNRSNCSQKRTRAEITYFQHSQSAKCRLCDPNRLILINPHPSCMCAIKEILNQTYM